MPGVLIMTDQHADDDEKPKIALAKELNSAKLPSLSNGQVKVNCEHALPQVDGPTEVPAHENGTSYPNSKSTLPPPNYDVIDGPSISSSPPPLEHVTNGFQPLSRLIERTIQDCYNDLIQLVEQINSEGDEANINGRSALSEPSQKMGSQTFPSFSRRGRIMEFANKHRERFIKLLVLSKWSRNIEDIRTMVDLWQWHRLQHYYYDDVKKWVGQLRLSMHRAKVPDPDIPTALETLATGHATWLPDLGYVPKDPLTAKEMIRLLREIDTLLILRLHLHENIPRWFEKWTVDSGRATFVVPQEFELDLSIADKDPKSQFYFIDLRFLFTPASSIPGGHFRAFLEVEVNKILAHSGLAACYEFLHNFILTHKVQILKKQSYDLAMRFWVDAIKVESVHRMLVLQYWVDPHKRKNWIEIGISSGASTDRKASWKGPPTSHIDMRWMRHGSEVKDTKFKLDASHLSMEKTLMRIVAQHSSYIMTSIHTKLDAVRGEDEIMAMKLSVSEDEPADVSLEAQLGPSSRKITVIINQFTGRFGFRPLIKVPPRLEYEINALDDPATEAHKSVAILLCYDLHCIIDMKAGHVGWGVVRNISVHPGTNLFNREILRLGFYRADSWTSRWAMAVLINLTGESWWIVETVDEGPGQVVLNAILIPVTPKTMRREPVTRELLRTIERIAMTMISIHSLSRDLTQSRIPHSFRKEIAYSPGATASSIEIPVLYIKYSSLAGHKTREEQWASEFLRLTYQAFDLQKGTVTHVLKGIMSNPSQIRELVYKTNDDDIAFHDTGGFAVFVRTNFGAPVLDKLRSKLEAIGRLRNMVIVLGQKRFQFETISASCLLLSYANDQRVEVNFREGAPIRILFPPENPHARIRVFLAHLINDIRRGPELFAFGIENTIHLMRLFERISRFTASPASVGLAIHTRNADWYRLSYRNPPCSFEIRLRLAREEAVWHVQRVARKDSAATVPPGLVTDLNELFNSVGDDWKGIQSGITAGFTGIATAMEKLHNIVVKYSAKIDNPDVVAQILPGAVLPAPGYSL